ncbi:hypothetical protein B0J18DRAFT_105552 [Chaetomium sp. MPI-SDFR-AT-0129]|nr:hypothetical protein B0J18DRAFT_105552 [Chaetomium sp. MPI-SDFR-AT-0129]
MCVWAGEEPDERTRASEHTSWTNADLNSTQSGNFEVTGRAADIFRLLADRNVRLPSWFEWFSWVVGFGKGYNCRGCFALTDFRWWNDRCLLAAVSWVWVDSVKIFRCMGRRDKNVCQACQGYQGSQGSSNAPEALGMGRSSMLGGVVCDLRLQWAVVVWSPDSRLVGKLVWYSGFAQLRALLLHIYRVSFPRLSQLMPSSKAIVRGEQKFRVLGGVAPVGWVLDPRWCVFWARQDPRSLGRGRFGVWVCLGTLFSTSSVVSRKLSLNFLIAHPPFENR